jgi:nitrilase
MTRKVKVAAAQMAPVFLNRDATVDKVVQWIREAGANGAQLVAFPEAVVPGFPYWASVLDPLSSRQHFNRILFNQAVEIPSAATRKLCDAARAASCAAVVGLTEREGGTLYNSQLFISADGSILGKRRKLVPTSHERMIWGRGDGEDLRVFPTPIGVLGALICYEHSNALFRYALQAQGEQIHIANWPGGTRRIDDVVDAAIRHYSFEGQAFVVNCTAIMTQEILDTLGKGGSVERLQPGGGFSAIVGPPGVYLAGPERDRETLIYAELDFDQIADMKMIVDSSGHYARPDVARLVIKRGHLSPLVIEDGEETAASAAQAPDSAQ